MMHAFPKYTVTLKQIFTY